MPGMRTASNRNQTHWISNSVPQVPTLCGEMTVAALDALVGDAQGRIGAVAHGRLLMRDGHLHHDAVQPLDLVRVEPGLHRQPAQPLQQQVLALAIAERARRGELGLDDALDDLLPLGDQRDDLAIDRLDAIAQCC